MLDPSFVRAVLLLLGVGAAALLVHVALFRMVFRFGLRRPGAQRLRRWLRWPARTTTVLVALLVALPFSGFEEGTRAALNHLLVIAIIVATAWLVLRGIRVIEETTLGRLDIGARDNLHARRRLTQVVVLRRVATVAVLVLAAAGILLTFENARSVGASVLASAGVLGLVAGVAARSTLGNLVAGLQIVFAEPIRLDDVVVVEGEWGNIEEITLTYVVVRIWDRRRLVLPTTYFVERPFQNWTRERAQVIGSVSLHLDYRAPIAALRDRLQRCLDASERWDGDVGVLQVVDASESTIHVRALMSAEDAPTAWDLRCEVREGLIGWLQAEAPEALPTRRLEVRTEDAVRTATERARPAGRGADAHIEDAFSEHDEPPVGTRARAEARDGRERS